MIDPASGWFKIRDIKDKTAIKVAYIVEKTWLIRYPWPTEITYNKGTEFMAEFATMIKNNYGIRKARFLKEIHKPTQLLNVFTRQLEI